MGDSGGDRTWWGLNELQLAYALFRITLGVNILGHGLVRIVYFGPGGLEPWVLEQRCLLEHPGLDRQCGARR